MHEEGDTITTDSEIADILNNHFRIVYTSENLNDVNKLGPGEINLKTFKISVQKSNSSEENKQI